MHLHRSRRPLGSELQPLPHMEALSAGEASLFAVQAAPTLSVAAFDNMITKDYVTTFCGGLQAAERFLFVGAAFCALFSVRRQASQAVMQHTANTSRAQSVGTRRMGTTRAHKVLKLSTALCGKPR